METVGDYTIGKNLGEGSFGKVKLGIHKTTNEKVALKFVSHHGNIQRKFEVQREVRSLRILDHPNIVKLQEVIELPDCTCLVFEYVEGKELYDYVVEKVSLSEAESAKIVSQLLNTVEYMHSRLVIHRDLKPENILIDNKQRVKIMDFGLSTTMKLDGFLAGYCGSPLYASPEILNSSSYIGPEVDVWSLGVTTFAMVCGSLPWVGKTTAEQLRHAVQGKYVFPSFLSFPCRDFIGRMLTMDAKKRATVAELRCHPWLLRHNCGITLPVPKKPSNLDYQVAAQLHRLGFTLQQIAEDVAGMKTTSQAYVLYHTIKQAGEQQRV